MTDNVDSVTDISLLERLARPGEPDEAAWSEFVRRYGGRVYRWCLQWKLQHADAEDVTQDVLTRIARHMQSFTYMPGGSFRSWLKTVTHHAWQDFLKSRRRTEHRQREAALRSLLTSNEASEDLQQQLSEEFDSEILSTAIVRVKRRVATHTWQAFHLTAIEGIPAREAGLRLSISVASVYQARRNVQLKLREEMKQLELPPAVSSDPEKRP